MEKIVVVSTNNNPDYYFYSPYIYKAWNKLGWKVCTMITSDVSKDVIHSDYIIRVGDIEGLRKETIAQASRLYAANYFSGDYYLMVSDMDLLPLSDYWHPELDKITSYGHDLTGQACIPMGYIGMPLEKWKEVMKLGGLTELELERDAKEIGIAYQGEWEKWWNHDWTLLTKRLYEHGKDKITFIDRGQVDIAGATLAKGRVDRYNWKATLESNPILIDAHCENVNVRHEEKLPKFLDLFERVWGKL